MAWHEGPSPHQHQVDMFPPTRSGGMREASRRRNYWRQDDERGGKVKRAPEKRNLSRDLRIRPPGMEWRRDPASRASGSLAIHERNPSPGRGSPGGASRPAGNCLEELERARTGGSVSGFIAFIRSAAGAVSRGGVEAAGTETALW
ncbi:hypothetical protein CPLU01_01877 [Colletotrichum plurivorum]|uniref:Uncharacterized protein n=1 Tax=Colletotrichum plurivorum TaxID=2175906 RepID=A0A8H6KXE8_9PEZI|nr:hypothetical protein CPLU01_01877 [Colletotrichum plurivorum]